nr:MATE efflux family protein [Tanacetum cinerariifolium]
MERNNSYCLTPLHTLLIWGCCKHAGIKRVRSWESTGCKNIYLGCIGSWSIVEVIIAITTLMCSRTILGYGFGNEKKLVDYVKDITPLLCFTIFADTIQAILSGVARGSGWQHVGAYITLGSYHLTGIPMALILCFVVDLSGKGLWSGLIIIRAMHSAYSRNMFD